MYVYLHTNGTYHYKPDIAVNLIGSNQYFNSPFIKQYWHFNSKEEAEKFVEKQKNKD
jgi:hypothetical protein